MKRFFVIVMLFLCCAGFSFAQELTFSRDDFVGTVKYKQDYVDFTLTFDNVDCKNGKRVGFKNLIMFETEKEAKSYYKKWTSNIKNMDDFFVYFAVFDKTKKAKYTTPYYLSDSDTDYQIKIMLWEDGKWIDDRDDD